MLIGLKSALIGAVTADCYAIGVDGEYDITKISQSYYHFNEAIEPIKDSRYYGFDKSMPSKYGLQILLAMDFIKSKELMPNKDFKKFWLTAINDYNMYDDFYKKLIRKLNYQGAREGFDEQSLGYVTMLLPFMIDNKRLNKKERQEIVEYIHCLDQNAHIEEIAYLFYEMTLLGSDGVPPSVFIKLFKHNKSELLKRLIKLCNENLNMRPQQLLDIKNNTNHIENNLFYTLFIIIKYENNFEEAIIQNNLLGGETATRAGIIGMVLGSYLGIESIPYRWIDNYKYGTKVLKWLENY